MTPLLALIGAAAAIITALGAIIIDRRLHSGQINTTEAGRLWDEATKMRADLATEVIALRTEVGTLKAEVVTLRAELAAAREAQAEIGELRRENQRLRKAARDDRERGAIDLRKLFRVRRSMPDLVEERRKTEALIADARSARIETADATREIRRLIPEIRKFTEDLRRESGARR